MLGRRAIALAIFVLCSALYIWTMCPTVYTMDCGELILAAHRLQIAHTTGYPLFCILGKIFTYLIPFGSIAWRINVMNALFAAGAISVLFLALSQITRKPAAAFVAGLFAISPIFWDIATSAEVHGLSVFIMATELYLFLRWRRVQNNRLLCYLALMAGLGLTNHLSSALILPGILYGVLVRDRSILRDRALVLRSVLMFALPLSLYAYLPLRAAASRGQIWGDIYSATGFLAYVTGKWFRPRMFSMTGLEVWENLLKFLILVIRHFPIYLAWAIPIGGLIARRRHRGLLGLVVVMLVINVVYNTNYMIPDIEPYYVPSMLALSICLAVALNAVCERRRRPGRTAIMAALPVILLLTAITGFSRANKHDAWFIMDYARNALETSAKDGLVIACGDSCFNAIIYAQQVDKLRPDVIVAHREIMRAWPATEDEWTARHYYDAVSKRSPAMQRFRWSNMKHDRLDVHYEKLLADVIDSVMNERPVYIICIGNDYESHPIMRHLGPGFRLLPEGLLYRVYRKTDKVDPAEVARRGEELWKQYQLRRIFDGSIRGGELEMEVPNRCSVFLAKLGDLELQSGMFSEAEQNFQKALTINPKMTHARNGLGTALACQRRYREAAKEWNTVLSTESNDEIAAHGLKMIQAALD